MAQTTPRQYHTQQVHYLRKVVNFNDTGISSGVRMGTLPSGAKILFTTVHVETVFNAATTNVLTVGQNSSSYNDMVAAGDVNEASATGTMVLRGADLTLSSDTDVFAKYTQSGTAATTGKAVIVVAYAPNNDQ